MINNSAVFFANACVKTQVPLHYWLRNFKGGEYLTLLLVVVREGESLGGSCRELVRYWRLALNSERDFFRVAVTVAWCPAAGKTAAQWGLLLFWCVIFCITRM